MIKVNRLALCLAFGGRLVIMSSLHLPAPPHKHQGSPTITMRQRIHSSQRPSQGLRVSQAGSQPHCHTCMESALTISPPSRWPSCNARVDLPVPVAPRITTRGSVRCTPRSPGPKETARAAATAAILKCLRLRESSCPHDNRQCACANFGLRREGTKRGGSCGTKVPKLKRLPT